LWDVTRCSTYTAPHALHFRTYALDPTTAPITTPIYHPLPQRYRYYTLITRCLPVVLVCCCTHLPRYACRFDMTAHTHARLLPTGCLPGRFAPLCWTFPTVCWNYIVVLHVTFTPHHLDANTFAFVPAGDSAAVGCYGFYRYIPRSHAATFAHPDPAWPLLQLRPVTDTLPRLRRCSRYITLLFVTVIALPVGRYDSHVPTVTIYPHLLTSPYLTVRPLPAALSRYTLPAGHPFYTAVSTLLHYTHARTLVGTLRTRIPLPFVAASTTRSPLPRAGYVYTITGHVTVYHGVGTALRFAAGLYITCYRYIHVADALALSGSVTGCCSHSSVS